MVLGTYTEEQGGTPCTSNRLQENRIILPKFICKYQVSSLYLDEKGNLDGLFPKCT